MSDDHPGQGRCLSCVHWRRPWREASDTHVVDRPNRDDETEWGVCSKIMHAGHGSYTAEEAQRWGWPAPSLGGPSRRAFTADGSDYLSELSTRADFGCVEFTPAFDPGSEAEPAGAHGPVTGEGRHT